MGLFDVFEPQELLAFVVPLSVVSGIEGVEEEAQIAQEMFRAGIAADQTGEYRVARAAWLAKYGAESSFPCGTIATRGETVARPSGRARPLNVPTAGIAPQAMVVTAVILPDAVSFIREPFEGEEPVVREIGRIARDAIEGVSVLDARGFDVARPAAESFDRDPPALVSLRWRGPDGSEDDRFAFGSASVAWTAADRLAAARSAAAR